MNRILIRDYMSAFMFASIAAVSVLPIASIADSGHDHSSQKMETGQAPRNAEAPMVDGTIKKIDRSTGKVTLAHGALVNLGMPAMTMVFRVKDIAWLDQMKEGNKIRFVADNVNGVITVVRFESGK